MARDELMGLELSAFLAVPLLCICSVQTHHHKMCLAKPDAQALSGTGTHLVLAFPKTQQIRNVRGGLGAISLDLCTFHRFTTGFSFHIRVWSGGSGQPYL